MQSMSKTSSARVLVRKLNDVLRKYRALSNNAERCSELRCWNGLSCILQGSLLDCVRVVCLPCTIIMDKRVLSTMSRERSAARRRLGVDYSVERRAHAICKIENWQGKTHLLMLTFSDAHCPPRSVALICIWPTKSLISGLGNHNSQPMVAA